MSAFRKISGYLLVGIVFLLTALAILGIWEVIDFEHVVRKSIMSLFVIFVAAVVILFILTVIIKDNKQPKNNNIS
ncbi:MAG TPA: hypothetical protein PLO05_01395 [Bacteroidales bacterium]|jgi:glucan phosphoethanolaminetransferase (alkaline phosphatase superfamily)|nr:hypothetical protein [Bacteroidales bacterium]MDD4234803.1 hypothetical protein [Bacteroidales bacterium]MDY0160861.1 hypothetical protein [Bacteroidales bacterium]HXK80795.1 hypothetical protein [Bacteroidales bacterium]